MSYLWPVAVGLLLWLCLWRFLFRELRQLQGKLSLEIRERLLPDAARSTAQLVTLASASFVLTFTLVQVWGARMVAGVYLVSAWVAFVLSVSAGVVLGIGLLVYRALCNCMVSAFGSADQNGTMSANLRHDWVSRVWRIEKFLFPVLTLQPVAFLVGLLYVLAFALLNFYGADAMTGITESDGFLGLSVAVLLICIAGVCALAVAAYRAIRKRHGSPATNRPGVA